MKEIFLLVLCIVLWAGCGNPKENNNEKIFIKCRTVKTHWGGNQSKSDWKWQEVEILKKNGTLTKLKYKNGDLIWEELEKIEWKKSETIIPLKGE